MKASRLIRFECDMLFYDDAKYLQPTNCLSVLDHFVGLVLKGLINAGYHGPLNMFEITVKCEDNFQVRFHPVTLYLLNSTTTSTM